MTYRSIIALALACGTFAVCCVAVVSMRACATPRAPPLASIAFRSWA